MVELQKESQHETISRYKERGLLHIPILEPMEVVKIANIYQECKNRRNLSLMDCSVWYYAKKNNYVLLTGDRKLRTASLFDGVEVRGIIHVFDNLVECGVIPLQVAIERLQLLYETNSRLPKDEIQTRLTLWKSKMAMKGEAL